MKNEFNEKELENQKYSEAYSEESFWDKVKEVAKKVGAKGIYAALILYYVLQREDVPTKSKAIILAALGYFIFPIDLIPDMIPLLGFTDDVTALYIVVKKVSEYINEDVTAQAKDRMKDWFSISEDELNKLLIF